MWQRMWQRIWIITVALAVLLATAGISAQGQAPAVQVERSVLAAGGEQVSAGDYVVVGTIGEAVVAESACAGAVCASAGFWGGAGPAPSLFLPVIQR